MKNPDLRTLCDEWQKRLRLQDWDVHIEYRSAEAMDENEGSCLKTEPLMLANIAVLDPADYHNNRWPQTIEVTVVHELLHLWMWPFMPDKSDKLKYTAAEQAIQRISEALVGAKNKL